MRFVPFDPATKMSEAFVIDREDRELHIAKGAFEVIAKLAEVPADAGDKSTILPQQGNRVIAVAAGAPNALRLVGLIALSDPPREDSAKLVATLRDMRVRTVMVTGDSPVTAQPSPARSVSTAPSARPSSFPKIRASTNSAYSRASFPSRSTSW